jgi:regulator of protease activity HflC (stomatin/prohibitin superfamily)
MFVLFIFALIFIVVGIACAFGGFFGHDGLILVGGVGGVLLGLVLVFVSCIRTVGTKEIGVPTSFGKVGTSHYGSGFHLTAPWTSIHEMDGAIQTDDHLDKSCFQVRIANQQTGCAEVSLQWRINPNYVDYDYKNYRSFSHLEKQLVDRKLFSAVNDALASYNPLNSVGAKTNANPLPRFQTDIFELMKQKVKTIDGKPLITVLNVQLPIVHFDEQTQNRINQLQQQVAQTRIADQEFLTNQAQSKANDALRKSVQNDPNVLVARCFTILNEIVKQNGSIPPGFSCWPGGSQTPVIASASK